MSIDREESLFLTVSENHEKREYQQYTRLMSEPFRRAGGMIALYESVILGGGDKLFGLEELELWLRRHRYAAYNMHVLLPITHMCLEYVVRQRLSSERPGIPSMAEQAARELLETDPLRLCHSPRGWTYIYWLTEQFPEAASPQSRQILRNFSGFEDVLELFLQLMQGCNGCMDARSLVEQAVQLYKEIFTKYFAPDHSHDELPMFEISDDLWEGKCPAPELNEPTEIDESETELQYEKASGAEADEIVLPEDMLAAIPEYLAENFGPSFQTEKALEEIEQSVCVGIHEGRRLLFTDGLPESAYEEETDRARALRKCRSANLQMLEEHRDSAQQGIRSIEQAFQNALNLRNEPEIYRADRGVLVNSVLWKVGRCDDPQLFNKIFRQDLSTVVVELLIDASGSQSVRQSMEMCIRDSRYPPYGPDRGGVSGL